MIAISEISKLALQSLFRNKTRSLLTMLGIIIGVSAVILLVSIGQGLQKYITEQFEALGTNIIAVLPGRVGRDGNAFSSGPPNFTGSKFTLRDVDELSRLSGPIELVGAGIENPSAISYRDKTKYTTVAGMTEDYSKMRNFKVSSGRMITDADTRLSRNVVVLGIDVIEELFGGSSSVGKEVTIGGQKFQVIGVLSDLGTGGFGVNINDFAIIPITSAQKVFGIRNVQAMAVKAVDKDSIPEAIEIVEKHLAKKYDEDEFSVVDQSNLLASINQILGVVTLGLGGIAAISLVVGGGLEL